MRVAFFAATETPFLRSTTTACSKSPLASVSACLQSIIGAPVFSRRSFTCAAEIFTVVVLIKSVVGRWLLVVSLRHCDQPRINSDPRRRCARGSESLLGNVPSLRTQSIVAATRTYVLV